MTFRRRMASNRVGLLVDVSGALRREDGNARALAWCDQLAARRLSARQAMLLEYFRANVWGNRQKERHGDAQAAWEWEQPELQQQIFHLRGAVSHAIFAKLSRLRRSQILTNLGNQLNTVGRFVDAAPMWDRVLADNPRFGMALGNRGYGRIQYAKSLYDTGHRGVFLYFAHKDLTGALSSKAMFEGDGYPDAKAVFDRLKNEVEISIDLKRAERLIKMEGYPLGRSMQERHYRSWALRHVCFSILSTISVHMPLPRRTCFHYRR